jgi:3',5'-cyclic AMP phosphodiesterase CpdA
MAGTAVLMTLAQISDLHLPLSGGFDVRQWTMKRSFGYLNWQLLRKKTFSLAVVEALIADMRLQNPDHVVVTGDLVNLGLPSELEAATGFLRTLGTPEGVSVVPGNHDIYARLRGDNGVRRWQAYMSSDEFGREQLKGAEVRDDGFPFVRRRGPVVLIGLNSALPMPPFVAAGKLGAQQLSALEIALKRLSGSGLVRIVLIHHPPLASLASRRRRLLDASDFEKLLFCYGADLVLHGHNHTNSLVWAPGLHGNIPIVGISAGGMVGTVKGPNTLARYNLIRVLENTGGKTLELIGRGAPAVGAPVVAVERRVIGLEGHASLSPS